MAAVSGLALAGGLAGCGLGGDDVKTMTASFERTVGLYENSDVRILGVPIGRVTSIEPKGDVVEVGIEYDAKYDIPAEAQAVVVAPSIVSDRYVQLTPVYTTGATLEDGAVLGTDRTFEPVELDDIYASLDKLNVSLGPEGANKDGALSDLLDVSAKNLDGNGELLGQTLEDFATLVTTVSDQRDDLFGTVSNLQDFTTTIANADGTVRSFNRDLAEVADQLEGEREDLARAVSELSVALGEVATFVRENEDLLKTNITDLASVTSVLVKQRTALEEFLDVSPDRPVEPPARLQPVDGHARHPRQRARAGRAGPAPPALQRAEHRRPVGRLRPAAGRARRAAGPDPAAARRGRTGGRRGSGRSRAGRPRHDPRRHPGRWPMSARRASTALLATGLAVSSLAGCGFRGAASIPLPGGQGQGDDAYSLTIEFQDVLDLVPQSAVKVDDVTVGSVSPSRSTATPRGSS